MPCDDDRELAGASAVDAYNEAAQAAFNASQPQCACGRYVDGVECRSAAMWSPTQLCMLPPTAPSTRRVYCAIRKAAPLPKPKVPAPLTRWQVVRRHGSVAHAPLEARPSEVAAAGVVLAALPTVSHARVVALDPVHLSSRTRLHLVAAVVPALVADLSPLHARSVAAASGRRRLASI